MLTEGRYTGWFKTPVGEGAGEVVLGPNGKLSGGDTTFAYCGTWEQNQQRFRATLCAKRTFPGPPGVFGLDAVDIVVSGSSDGGMPFSCTGFAKQSPGLKLEVTFDLVRDK